MGVEFSTKIDITWMARKIQELVNDEKLKLEIHTLFEKMMQPYVPRDEGVLAQHTEVTPDYVRYIEPYAHYQYMGEVYGPNFPVFQAGVVTGWRSPPSKYPTGRELGIPGENPKFPGWVFGYRTPGTGHHWDKKMMQERGQDFIHQVTEIVKRRAAELNG